jgi:hypothetical protein
VSAIPAPHIRNGPVDRTRRVRIDRGRVRLVTWWPLARDVGGAHDSGLHDALGGGNAMPITAFHDAGDGLVDVNRGALPEAALRADLQQLFGITTGA